MLPKDSMCCAGRSMVDHLPSEGESLMKWGIETSIPSRYHDVQVEFQQFAISAEVNIDMHVIFLCISYSTLLGATPLLYPFVWV